MATRVLFSTGVSEEVLLFLCAIIAGVEAAKGVLTGGRQSDVPFGKFCSSTGVLSSLDFLECGLKLSFFIATLFVDSLVNPSDGLFWLLFEVEMSCTFCPPFSLLLSKRKYD